MAPFISDDTTPAQEEEVQEEEAKAHEAAPDLLKPFKLDPKTFKAALDANERIYVIRVHTIKDLRLKNRTPLDFFKDIEALGTFLDSYMDLSPIQGLDSALDADLIFAFLFSAPMERDLIAGAFDMSPDNVIEVPEDTVSEIAALDKPREAQPPPEKVPATKTITPKEKNVAAPKPKAKPKPAPKVQQRPGLAGGGKQLVKKKAEETVRVSVPVLDELMTLAGEMVSGRNQLMRLSGPLARQEPALPGVVQNINLVTTELQEKVMQTRLQPIGSILGKFNRIIRDLGAKLKKDIELEITGKDVELDRSILEAISDPLTHLIRNCADHAIETPDEREAAGKSRRGTVKLIARHAGGQVHVEIIDNGKGIDPDMLRRKVVEKGLLPADEVERMSDRQAQGIIFLAGFSSAEEVSDVSGRGVGMDVVKTNIEELGGSIELDSKLGIGTRICLKLPLTLAIVPAMIVLTGGSRFAVPQVNLEEVVNLDGKQHKVETVRGSPVLRLRNRLLPLVSLRALLEIPDTIDGKGKVVEEGEKNNKDKYIMVLNADQDQYGLMVDDLLNIEEIVVKPVSRYLQTIDCYSGATILGDGKVALILDTTGMTSIANIKFDQDEREDASAGDHLRVGESQSLLLFRNTMHERFAINLAMVARIEKIQSSDIDMVGDREYIKYLGHSLRLVRLHDYLPGSFRKLEAKNQSL